MCIMSLLRSFCFRQFGSPFLGVFRLVPGFVEFDAGMLRISRKLRTWQMRDDEDPSKTILVTIKVLAFDFELSVSA